MMLIPWMKRMRPTKVQQRVNQSNPPCKLVLEFSFFFVQIKPVFFFVNSSPSPSSSDLNLSKDDNLLNPKYWQKAMTRKMQQGRVQQRKIQQRSYESEKMQQTRKGKKNMTRRFVSRANFSSICFNPFPKLCELIECGLNLRIWANSSFRNRC